MISKLTSQNKKIILGALGVCLTGILWGLDGTVLTPRLYNLDTAFVVFMLHAIPFLIMNFFLYKEYRYLSKFEFSDIIYLFLISFFGGALGTLAIVKALFLVNFQQLSVVILLQKLQPVFAITLAAILLKEKLSKNFIFWSIIAIVASYFLTFGFSVPRLDTDANTTLAALYALLAAFSFGSSTVFGKKILNKYSFHTATFYRFGFTTIIMIVYLLITNGFSEFNSITSTNWLIFFIIAFTTGSGAIFLYYFSLKNIKATTATICELCFPMSAILFDYLINKSSLSVTQWLAVIVLIFSIIQVTRIRRKK